MRRLSLVTLLLICAPNNLFGANKIIDIKTGETRSIEIPESSQIFVSQKGHISLTHDHGNHWLVSGLRAGAVKITARLRTGEEQNFLINVSPRQLRSISSKERLRKKNHDVQDTCVEIDDGHVYVIKISVELMDNSNKQDVGFEPAAKINLTRDHFDLSVGIQSEPYKNAHQRQIIASPVVLSKACNEILIRTGGEDEITGSTNDGRASTAWKTHGLDVKLKIIPLASTLLKIPFYVGLRTPSKGQGSYSLTDVQSMISTTLEKETLAAIINLSSMISFEKSQFWFSELPIIGPWFRRRDNTKANSTLLVWFKINQISVKTDTP
jgi:hypothetical protein